MRIISEPLHIGAADLLKGVEYSHYGGLYVHVKKGTISFKKWKLRYVILSEGCLYIYEDKNSKKPEEAYSLKYFENVRESEPEDSETICFCLHYKSAKPPKLFSCDTSETREEWIKKLRSEMSEVQSTFYSSNDSGFGSAGTVPTCRVESDIYETEELDNNGRKYDKVDERRFQKAFQQDEKATHTVRNAQSEDTDYEPVNFPCKIKEDFELANQGSSEGLRAIENKAHNETEPDILMEELKSKLNSGHNGLSSATEECEKATQSYTSSIRRGSCTSVASSFLSVQGGDGTSDNVTSLSSMSVQTQEHMIHVNVGGIKKTEHLETKPYSFLDELKSKFNTGHMGLASVGERGKSTKVPTSTTFRRHSMTSVTSSFLSIREGDDISDNVKYLASQSVQMKVSMYEIDNDSDKKTKEDKTTGSESEDHLQK